MSRSPFFLIFVLAGAALLTGMVNCQAPAQTAPPAPAAGGTEAAALLDRAIEKYAPGRVAWVEMALWQQTADDGVVYEVRGRFLAAPGYRLRLELKTQVGGTRGEMKVVSDGKSLWHWKRFDTDAPTALLWELPKEPPPGQPPEWVPWARSQVLRDYAFGGVGSVLKVARDCLRGLQSRTIRWRDRDVVQVTGSWPEDPKKMAEVFDFIRPRHVPRTCTIYLDARTLWPYRVEWWGSERPNGTPVLMMQTEFRDPVLNQPLPPERCAREFAIPS